MRKRNWITLAAIVASICIVLAVSARTRPVLLSVSPDRSELRPRNHCIMNPFRDRSPERAAERYLSELRAGHAEVLTDLVASDNREHIIDAERKWPVESWRVGRRRDTPNGAELMYWVKRADGYSSRGDEEEVSFRVLGFGPQARVVGFGAIY